MSIPDFIKVDLSNAHLCLTCPLAECVFARPNFTDKYDCPIYQREQSSRNAATRRWTARQQVARKVATDEN